MAGIRLEFAQFGDFDSFDIIRSNTSMSGLADVDLPDPIITGLTTMYYVDTSIVLGSTYYYKVRVNRDAESVVSAEIEVVAELGDKYWSNVVSLLHFDGVNGSTDFIDEKGNVWVRVGSPTISTEQSAFGGASGRFTSGNYIKTGMSPAFDLGTGDFTLEALIYIPQGATFMDDEIPIIVAGQQNIGGSGQGWDFVLFDRSPPKLRIESALLGTAPYCMFDLPESLPRNTFLSIAISRVAGVCYGFYKGLLLGTSTGLNGVQLSNPNNHAVLIGSGSSGAGSENYYHTNGYYDEIRITKGYGRYTSSYTPASGKFPHG
ncbi:hypothetical protein [Acinetobacter bereziniae]|uniref:hypothetical protein n=1 Tax=Acinetobacter bereziniae TaxID=106648 RepID=UPI0012509238|nr:hypothetical protein [Acinetobacter bereziniae]